MEMFDCPCGIISEESGTQDWKGRKGSSSHIPSNRSPRAATWWSRDPRASCPHPDTTSQHSLWWELCPKNTKNIPDGTRRGEKRWQICHQISEIIVGLLGETQRWPAQEMGCWSSVPPGITAHRMSLICSVLSPLVFDWSCTGAGPAAWVRQRWELERAPCSSIACPR